MKQKTEKYINELRQVVNAAAWNYEIWWAFKEKESRTKYVDTMNYYPEFFLISIHAHFVAMLVALYCLYEQRKDSINIPGLIKLLDKGNGISKEAVDRVLLHYNEAKPLWIKVSVLRNGAFGHRSNTQSVYKVFQHAGVTPNELKKLIKKTMEILKDVTQDGDLSVHELKAKTDTIQLLEDLKSFNEKFRGSLT